MCCLPSPAVSQSRFSLEGCGAHSAPGPGQKTQEKPQQTQCPCSCASDRRYADPLAQTCTRCQLETGHSSETTGPERGKRRKAMSSLSQEVAIFRFQRNNRRTKNWTCNNRFSFPDSINARFVDLNHETMYFLLI